MREGIGNLLAEGTYLAALKIGKMKGKDVLQYAGQSKGIGIGAHGIRSGKDFSTDIGYACSVQCGDHTSITDLPEDGAVGEVWAVLNDSAICCNFSGGFGLPRNLKFDFYDAVTGLALTRESWSKGGAKRALEQKRSSKRNPYSACSARFCVYHANKVYVAGLKRNLL